MARPDNLPTLNSLTHTHHYNHFPLECQYLTATAIRAILLKHEETN